MNTPAREPSGVDSEFSQQLTNYAKCEHLANRLQAEGKPVPAEVTRFMQEMQQQLPVYFPDPKDQQTIISEVRRRGLDIAARERQQSVATQRAEALRQTKAVAADLSKNIIDERNTLTPEQIEQYRERKHGQPFKTKVPTGRAHVDKAGLEAWAKQVGPMIGLKVKHSNSRNVRQKMDRLAELRTLRPDEFEKRIDAMDYPRQEIIEAVKNWENTSFQLSWAERLQQRDNENKVPATEEVTLTDGQERRLDLNLAVAQQVADEIDNDEDHAQGKADWFQDEISERTREDAALETLKLQEENPLVQGVSIKDGLIRAFDKHEQE